MSADEVIGALRGRHERSTQPSSKLLVATIDAINETLESQSLQPSYIAYFGACLSPLERTDVKADPDPASALCTVLCTVLRHMPSAHVRAKFGLVSPILCSAFAQLQAAEHILGQKACMQCLAQVLRSPEPSQPWAVCTQPFLLLAKTTMAENPKLRKVAADGLVEVMAVLSGAALHEAASNELVVLAAPKLAAKRAADSSQAQRTAAEAAIVAAVQDCLHFTGALQPAMPVLAEAAALEAAEELLGLFALQQPLLCARAAACLQQLVQSASNTGSLGPDRVHMLLKAVLPQLEAQQDADTVARLLAFADAACTTIVRLQPDACGRSVGATFVRAAPLLGAAAEGTRRAASDALRSIARNCVAPGAAAAERKPSGSAPTGLQRAVAALVAVLQPGYHDAWGTALPVVADVLRALGRDGVLVAQPLLAPLADMCRGSTDAAEHATQAHAALGAAIVAQGPRAVLAAVPINMDDLACCDVWLLALLRKHTVHAELCLWGEYLLPRGRAFGVMAGQAHAAGHGEAAMKLSALELQAWHCLASFANWAPDVPQAFAQFGDTWGSAFQKRRDLQAPICNMLRRIAMQTRAVLAHAGDSDGVGHDCDPPRGRSSSASDATSVAGMDIGDADAESEVESEVESDAPEGYAVDAARGNRACLRDAAARWLPQLLNTFAARAPDERAGVRDAIIALAPVFGQDAVAGFFKEALTKVVQALKCLQGQVEATIGDPASDFATFLDACLLLAPAMPDTALQALFKAVTMGVGAKSASAQKAAFKALARLVSRRPAILRGNLVQICQILVDTEAVQSAARRHRLACIMPVALLLSARDCPDVSGLKVAGGDTAAPDKAVTSALITELVLCTKEVNAKTRAQAYKLLVEVAHALHAAHPPRMLMDAEDAPALSNGGLEQVFSMVLAGLAARTPRMVSASVMALARLTFEFAPQLQAVAAQLLPAVCALLRTKARETVKAVLGFLKVAAMRVPVDMLKPHLGDILNGVLLWAEETKNRYKLKVRDLIKRLCKRCGLDAVTAAWPNSQTKLLTAVRKEMARTVRRKAGGTVTEGGTHPDAKTVSMARTARASEWRHSAVFSADGASTAAPASAGGKRAKAATARSGSKAQQRGGPSLHDDADAPVDLMDAATLRGLARGDADAPSSHSDAEGFARNKLGKLVIHEEKDEKAEKDAQRQLKRLQRRSKDGRDDELGSPKRKRKRVHEMDVGSDDSDFDDLRGIAGLQQAYKGTENASSLKKAGTYAHSQRTAQMRRSKHSKASSAPQDRAVARGGAHAGKFKAKKADGDVKGSSSVEPFAYWNLDKRLLNRRGQKKRAARTELSSVDGSAAPARGRKAKKKRV